MNNEALLNYLPNNDLLKDRVILVTGAGSGIGRAVSLAYARFGATVVLLGKKLKELEYVYDEIEEAGYPEPALYPLNMEGATAKDYQDMANTFNEKLGGLDGIVLNAGWLPAFMPFKEYDVETWTKTLSVNLHANFLIVQTCLPLLEEAKDPAIIFSAHDSLKAYNGAFGIAKAGTQAMMDILADEYDQENNFIRINSIDTGPLRTQMRKMNYPGEDMDTLALPESVVGPYLYFMGADAGNDAQESTANKVVFQKLANTVTWPGQSS